MFKNEDYSFLSRIIHHLALNNNFIRDNFLNNSLFDFLSRINERDNLGLTLQGIHEWADRISRGRELRE